MGCGFGAFGLCRVPPFVPHYIDHDSRLYSPCSTLLTAGQQHQKQKSPTVIRRAWVLVPASLRIPMRFPKPATTELSRVCGGVSHSPQEEEGP